MDWNALSHAPFLENSIVEAYVASWIEIQISHLPLMQDSRRGLCGLVDWNINDLNHSIGNNRRGLCGLVDWNEIITFNDSIINVEAYTALWIEIVALWHIHRPQQVKDHTTSNNLLTRYPSSSFQAPLEPIPASLSSTSCSVSYTHLTLPTT